MRMTAAILLLGCLTASATGIGQTVSLQLKDAPVKQALKEIIRQGKVTILYNEKDLEDTRPVTITLHHVSVEEALQQVLDNQPLQFSIKGKTISIVVKSGEDVQAGVNAPVVPPVIDVRGRVVNENGEPVLASVVVKGTKVGTTTNADGYFELKGVAIDATLVITAANIESLEIKINGRSELGVVGVKVKVESLGEVIINKGYYTEKQRFSVSNVGKVTAKDIEKQPVSNPLLALQGRVPGLFITQASGLPGSGITVRIQGVNSIGKGNDPLYVVDGVPYIAQLLPNLGDILGTSGSTSGNPFSYIDPSNIESIEVLKDADATAIYGSRAANGAILITTKKAKRGKTKVELNFQNGWGKVTRKLGLLNTKEYLNVRREGFRNDGIITTLSNAPDLLVWDTTRYTDWQKELIGGTARFTDIRSTFTGGNANLQYLFGIGYHNEGTVFPGKFSDRKGSLHFNISNSSTNRKFQVSLSGNYLFDNNHLPRYDLTSISISLPPNAPTLLNTDGSLNWAPASNGFATWTNPINYTLTSFNSVTSNFITNLTLSYQLLKVLQLKSNFGYTNLQTDESAQVPSLYYDPAVRPFLGANLRTSSFGKNNVRTWIVEPHMVSDFKIGNSKVTFLLGSTFQGDASNGYILNASGFNNDIVMDDIKSASAVTVASSLGSVYKYNALFIRIGYNLSDQLLLNLAARRDGSSRFGSKNQFHSFGSIGSAWIFTKNLNIAKSFPFLSFGKLRGSFGTTGNDQIGDYQYLNLFNPYSVGVPYQGTTSYIANGHANEYLEWEETKKLQFGIDLGFMRDRISSSITYYRNRSSNQLLRFALPTMTGFPDVVMNFPAKVENTGWEISLYTRNVEKKNTSWSTNFTLTIPNNKLLAFENISKSSYSNLLIVGKPITITKVYDYAGVDPSKGVFQFFDGKGGVTNRPDTLPSAISKTAFVNVAPRLFGGFQNTFTYKNLELNIFFQFSRQLGGNYLFGNLPGSRSNQPKSVLERWQKSGDIALIQRYSSNSSIGFSFLAAARQSTVAYSDASYLRLKNISLSWSMPTAIVQRLQLNNCRLFVQGQNILTFTKYKGMDPENRGIGNSAPLPPLRVLTFGVNATL